MTWLLRILAVVAMAHATEAQQSRLRSLVGIWVSETESLGMSEATVLSILSSSGECAFFKHWATYVEDEVMDQQAAALPGFCSVGGDGATISFKSHQEPETRRRIVHSGNRLTLSSCAHGQRTIKIFEGVYNKHIR